MSFFSGKTKTKSTAQHANAGLGDYTSAYRAFAPWEFATLDPTASLAALGQGTKLYDSFQKKTIDLGADFKKTLQGMSADEKAGAQASRDALARITERQTNGQFLTQQETEFINQSLDKAFEYAHKTGYTDWERGTQALAGSLGMRTSDSPVARPALQELRNFELGLGSQRAQMGLNATMQFSAQQNQFDESLREFQESIQQNRWQARQGFMFGGGQEGVANTAYTDYNRGTSKQKMGTLQKIGGFFSGAEKAMDFGSAAGAAYSTWNKG